MIIRLIIAGIRWNCRIPDDILSDAIKSFSSDFSESEDISLEIRFTDYFDVPTGKSITNNVLEWYIQNDGTFNYYLIKREEESRNILATLKANESWSHVLIEARYGNPTAIEIINILLTEIVFRNRLYFHDGLVIHASAIEFDGEAIAIAAPSGTGKSTHATLWQDYYKATIINDDHPAIRIIGGKPVIFGTPWAGERKKYRNLSSTLKGVVILEQGDTNEIWELNNSEIIREFLPRCFLPYYSKHTLIRAIRIFNELTNYIKVNKLICKPEREAATVVKDYLWANK